MSILHTLPLRERPAYKITRLGEGYCDTVDLLAAVVGGPQQVELAHALVAQFKSLPAMLNATDTELQEVAGIGPVTAARLKAALEIGRRLTTNALDDRVTIRSPGDTARLLMSEMSHLEHEHFVVLILNTRNQVTRNLTLYTGTANCMHICVAEVFTEAVRRHAAAIIIAHNHPSGDPTPSPEDVALTHNLVEAGNLLGIDLLDHVIIGQQRFVSLRERGLGGFV